MFCQHMSIISMRNQNPKCLVTSTNTISSIHLYINFIERVVAVRMIPNLNISLRNINFMLKILMFLSQKISIGKITKLELVTNALEYF